MLPAQAAALEASEGSTAAAVAPEVAAAAVASEGLEAAAMEDIAVAAALAAVESAGRALGAGLAVKAASL